MAKVILTAEVEPELERRVRIAASDVDKSVSEWIEEALRRELEDDIELNESDANRRPLPPEFHMPPPSLKPRGMKNPIKLRGGKTMAETVLEDRDDFDQEDDLTLAPAGAKPKGSKNPPRLKDGSTIGSRSSCPNPERR